MKLLQSLERRFRGLAVPNVTLWLVVLQGLCFLGLMVNPAAIANLQLNWEAVLAGEVWRLITFLFVPETLHPIFILFALYLLYLFGTALEHEWGAFRYNVYLLVAWGLTVAAAAIAPHQNVSNFFILGSIFLAFAYLYPDFTLLLFFILPVKVKWLAWLTWVGFAYAFLSAGNTIEGWQVRAVVLAAVANYFLFFGPGMIRRARDRRRGQRFRAEMAQDEGEPFHRCAVCGRTDQSDPTLQFRYQRTAEGVVCYCEDHVRIAGEEVQEQGARQGGEA